jgi:hypothetical protein
VINKVCLNIRKYSEPEYRNRYNAIVYFVYDKCHR